jgi:hypothetical protein
MMWRKHSPEMPGKKPMVGRFLSRSCLSFFEPVIEAVGDLDSLVLGEISGVNTIDDCLSFEAAQFPYRAPDVSAKLFFGLRGDV